MSRCRHAVLLAALAALAVPLHAQAGSAVAPGERVRVRVRAEHDHIVGTLVGRVGDTLVVDASDGRRERLPVGTVGRFERSRGRSAGLGARRGALWGAGIGAPILLLGGGAGSGGETAGAVLAWTALGAGIGAVRRPERWESTPLPAGAQYALIGAIPGAVLGGALGYALSGWGGSDVSAGQSLGGAVLLGALGAAATGSVGAVVGAAPTSGVASRSTVA